VSLGPIPLQQDLTTKGGKTTAPWTAWLQQLFVQARTLGQNGTTAQRPTGTIQIPLFIGQPYFDTTLGYMVHVKSLNPTVWVNGAGAVV
jgi:hypothetical protein